MNADTSTLASLAQLVSGTQHLVVEEIVAQMHPANALTSQRPYGITIKRRSVLG